MNPPTISPTSPVREILEFQSHLLRRLGTLLTERHSVFHLRVAPDGTVEESGETLISSVGPVEPPR